MNILFLHRNFPAQFRHLAQTLGQNPQNRVVFITNRQQGQIPGVQKLLYQNTREIGPSTHRYVRSLEEAVSEGQAAWRVAFELKKSGFYPDIIYAHSGWGVGLFMKDLFPKARYLAYFEWYYHAHGTDADFDPAEPLDADDEARIRIKNAPILLDLAACDGGLCPTHWQQQQFPPEFHPKLKVLHDGIDTEFFKPQTQIPAPLDLTWQDEQGQQRSLQLPLGQEIVTYVSRGLEPYRGFPQFMEAVVELQRLRPECHVVVVGEDRVAYGKKREDGKTYKTALLEELDLDRSRLHFSDRLPYPQYLQVLQASSCHIYLTRPFVLSWSCLEALSTGCLVVASATPPVQEVIVDQVNGFLVDFFHPRAIAAKVAEVLDRGQELTEVRTNARKTIMEYYSLRELLTVQLQWLKSHAR